MINNDYQISQGKVLSNSLVLDVVKHCNLSCRGCGHLSPVFKKNVMGADSLERDLSILTKYYHTDEVLILGGEPLLHPDLVSVLETVRDAKIGEKIKLLTNGLLLHKADPKFWQILDEVRVSIYPGKELSSAQQQVAVTLAERHGTTLTLQYYDIFRESILDKPNKDRQLLKRVFDTCLIAHKWHCNTIEEGHFYKCPQAYLIPNSKDPESKLSERDGIRLQDLSGFEQSLYTYLKAPHPLAACRNCLGTVGREFPHEQVSRRKWNEFQGRPVEEMVDFDHLKALENGLVQDVPTRNVTLVESGLICSV